MRCPSHEGLLPEKMGFPGRRWIVVVQWWLSVDLNRMKFRVKIRLIVFALGVALMGVLIAVVTVYSQRQAEDLRGRLRGRGPGVLPDR